VSFGPAPTLWEEQPTLRELYDQACAGLVRAECEADELRAGVALLLEERNILGTASLSKALRGTTVTKAAVTEGAEPSCNDSAQVFRERPEPPPHFNAALWKRAAVWNRAERLLVEAEHRVLRGIERRIRNERDEARDTVLALRRQRAAQDALIESLRDEACRESCRDKAAADGGWSNI
jgi:hypothetical protein